MEFEDGQPGIEPELKYDFTNARGGQSVWFATHGERVNASQAFERWKARTGSALTITTKKVGRSDPKGEGFRLYIHAHKAELKPAVIARLPKMEGLQPSQIFRLKTTGIETNADIETAALSCDPMPAGVTEANAVRKMIFMGETPYQIEYTMRVHGKTLQQMLAEGQERNRQVDEADAQRHAEQAEILARAQAEEAEAMRELEKELKE